MSAARGHRVSFLVGIAALGAGFGLGWWGAGTGARPDSPLRWEAEVREAASRFGVEAALVRAVIRAESGGRPDAVSRAGAVGLMQLLPATAEELARELGLPGRPDLARPETNILLGTAHLARLLERFGQDGTLALAAYNAGAARVAGWTRKSAALSSGDLVERHGAKETRAYVARVQRFLKTERSGGGS